MRILISGYHGFGNIGDEAILAALVAHLQVRHPGASLCALSADPAGTAAALGIDTAPRWSWRAVAREVRRADLLIQGGGGLLQDTTSAISPLYYLGILRLARLLRTPYAIFAQGLGPLQRPWVRKLARASLARATSITLRDEDSASFLHKTLGIKRETLVAPDPALCLEPSAMPGGTAVAALQTKTRPQIGLVIRAWPGIDPLLAAVRVLINRAADEWQAECVLIPFQQETDLPLCEQLAGETSARVVAEALTPAELVGLVGKLDLVVSMRLHALIFAASQATAAVGISYDPKVAGFCKLAGLPCIGLTDATSDRLWEMAAFAFRGCEGFRATYAGTAARLTAAARQHFEAIDEVIAGIETRHRRA